MVIIKSIFIFFMVLYAISKIVDRMNNKYKDNTNRFMNLIEIVVSIMFTLAIFKF